MTAAQARSAGPDVDQRSFELGVISAFAEVVAAGVKLLALSRPLTPVLADALSDDALAIARGFGLEFYRDRAFHSTDLFPAAYSAGKQVLVLAGPEALAAYHALKADVARLEAAGAYVGVERTAIARRFGRLLSYPEEKIEAMLAKA